MKNAHFWRLSPIAKAIGIVTVASVASMTSLQAHAQEPPKSEEQSEKEDEGAIETIVVTASKREQDMQDLAQSVMAFDNDQIERMGINSFADYAQAIPSLSFVSSNPGRNEVVFRGISTGSQEFRTDSSTAVYLDDIPMTSAAQQVDPRMVDIERVEALPGPQGTLMGSSSQSGALRIITAKPEIDGGIFGAIELEYSKVTQGDSSHRVEGHINIPMTDNFAIRVAGFSVEEGGYIDNVLGEDLFTGRTNEDAVEDDFNVWALDGARVIGLWQINEKWKAQFTYLTQDSETTGDWKSDRTLDEFEVVRFHKDIRTDDWWAAAATLTGDLGFAELTYTSSHLERDIFYEFDTMVADQLRTRAYGIDNYSNVYNPAYYNTAYDIGTIINDQTGRRTTHELRLASVGESRLQWLAGAFYETTFDYWDWYMVQPNLVNTPAFTAFNNLAYSIQNNYDIGTIYPIAPTDRYYGEAFTRNTDQLAIFGEIDYKLTDKFTVGVGLRWFEYERDRVEQGYWPFGVPYGNYESGGLDTYQGTSDDVVSKLSLKYEFDDDRMVYFSYSEGFRLGGDNNLRRRSVLPNTYESDKLFNHEIGFKSTLLDNNMRLNAAAYYMRWEDMQREIYDPVLVNSRGHANIGDARAIGFEASLTYYITDNLSIDASFFASSSEITEDFYFSAIFEEGVIAPENDYLIATKGQDLAISPDEKAWIGIDYTFPKEFLGASWWIRYDHSYTGSQSHDWYNAQNDNVIIDAYENANLQIGAWVDDQWDVTFSIWNVWDERAINWLHTGDDTLLAAYNIERYRTMPNYSRPREYGVTFKYYF